MVQLMGSPLRGLLDDVDETLVECLDDEDHLSIPTARRLLAYTEKMLAGELTPGQVHAECEYWAALVQVFLIGYGYGLEDLQASFDLAPLGGSDDAQPLTPADEAFLESLADWLSVHLDLRRQGAALVDWDDE